MEIALGIIVGACVSVLFLNIDRGITREYKCRLEKLEREVYKPKG